MTFVWSWKKFTWEFKKDGLMIKLYGNSYGSRDYSGGNDVTGLWYYCNGRDIGLHMMILCKYYPLRDIIDNKGALTCNIPLLKCSTIARFVRNHVLR